MRLLLADESTAFSQVRSHAASDEQSASGRGALTDSGQRQQGPAMGKDTSDRGLIASSLSPFMRQVGPGRAPWPGLGADMVVERPRAGLTCRASCAACALNAACAACCRPVISI